MSVFVLQGSGDASRRRIDYSKELNQEQLEVVLNGDGPCLVLAGAGSGKTRTITYRVAHLLEQGIDPQRILLLTFTNKASRELLERVSTLLGADTKGLWGGTFHSVANRMLRMNAERVGFTKSFSILDQDDSLSLVKSVMKELKIDPKARRFPTAAVVFNILSFARNTLMPIEGVLELKHEHFVPFASEIEEIGRIYLARKKAANAMDFDDLLINWINLLNDPEIGQRISMQFQYVLVDEYQDTNSLQATIVSLIAKEHKNILVVGDDAQSIYAFRGADVKNILSFPQQWPNAKMFKLLTNYRSVPEILELANDSLSHNRDQFQKDLIAVKPKGQKPVLVAASSARQEAQFVAEQILKLRAEGVALENMAVLFRSSAHSQALEFELLKRDVPYEYRGGMKFFGRAHIKDCLSYLRVYQNPQDETAWLRVLNLQQGIGSTTAMTVISRVRDLPDFKTIIGVDPATLVPSRGDKGWREFIEIAERVVARAPEPAVMLRAVLDSNYQDYLEREYPDWRERQEDLQQLAQFAESYDDVASFLADISLYDDVLAGREKSAGGMEERMILSTIHQAKGLEWDTVFIIHLADSAFPHKRSMGEEGGIEEERRLFYVAATRARRRLFLTYPLTSGFDALTFNQPSLFIEEISPRLMERMELREAGSLSRTAFLNERRQSSDESRTNDDWFWDQGFDEPTITIDRTGNRGSATPTQWKSSSKSDKKPPTSMLRDVGDL